MLALAAICTAVLALGAQASAAGPVTSVLAAAGATATEQLDTVAHNATTPLPSPTTLPAAVHVSASAAQSAGAVAPAIAGAAEAVRSTSETTEHLPAGDSAGQRSAHGGASSGPQPSSPPSLLAAAAKRVEHVAASPMPAAGEHTAIVPVARRIVSSRVERVAGTLTDAVRHAPATRALAGHASHIAGALLGTVAVAATSAGHTLAAIRVSTAAPGQPRSTLATDPFTPTTAAGGPSPAHPSVDPTVLVAQLATIAPAQAAPSSVDLLFTQPLQRGTTQRGAATDTRSGAHGALATTSPATNEPPLRASSHAIAPAAASSPLGAAIPAPSTGGFAPASSAGVGGGVSAATFLALAALLLLAAPRLMRRLRRNAAPWRLAQFSLIPARPG